MTKPAEVISLQMELYERLRGSLGDYLDDVVKAAKLTATPISGQVADALLNARAYRVQENMTAEILARAARLADDTEFGDVIPNTYEGIMPPRPTGFLVFDEPIRYPEALGYQEIMHMITWSPVMDPTKETRGWLVTGWNDRYREPDAVLETYPFEDASDPFDSEDYERRNGRWAPLGGWFLPARTEVGPVVWVVQKRQQAKAKALGLAVDGLCNINIRRHFAALWQLLGETIPAQSRPTTTEITDGHTSHSTLRRARNMGLNDPGVSVVTLRRERRPVQHPGTGRKQDYRQLVQGGFERTYWVGRGADKRPVKRRIDSYWTGPLGAPERQRRIVSELRR